MRSRDELVLQPVGAEFVSHVGSRAKNCRQVWTRKLSQWRGSPTGRVNPSIETILDCYTAAIFDPPTTCKRVPQADSAKDDFRLADCTETSPKSGSGIGQLCVAYALSLSIHRVWNTLPCRFARAASRSPKASPSMSTWPVLLRPSQMPTPEKAATPRRRTGLAVDRITPLAPWMAWLSLFGGGPRGTHNGHELFGGIGDCCQVAGLEGRRRD